MVNVCTSAHALSMNRFYVAIAAVNLNAGFQQTKTPKSSFKLSGAHALRVPSSSPHRTSLETGVGESTLGLRISDQQLSRSCRIWQAALKPSSEQRQNLRRSTWITAERLRQCNDLETGIGRPQYWRHHRIRRPSS
jgi:hypothetical protein